MTGQKGSEPRDGASCGVQLGGFRDEISSSSNPNREAIAQAAERIILRRLHEEKIDGYTLPMSLEITDAILSLQPNRGSGEGVLLSQPCADGSLPVLTETPAPSGAWRPIETAPKDGRRVLVILKDPIPVPGRADLRNWDGRPFVGRHMGGVSEWCFAAPVGQGGFPDAWMAGWMPFPPPPGEGEGK